jgi:8-oxo-dGTP pyrophosphatase MutT (NUDIX family)
MNMPAAPMSPAVPRDAATVIVVREGKSALEVLLLQRAERGDHNSGAWVFPGGLVDPGDRQQDALAFERAALRECFEECGILLARDAAGNWPQLDGAARAQLAGLRPQVASGAIAVEAVCAQFGLRPAYETLHFISHWLTPMGRAKRFDTRFFVTVVPHGQQALQDAQETVDHVWMTPAEALQASHSRRLMTPTRATIELLLPFDSVQALQAWAALPRTVERILPRLAVDASGVRPVQPHEPAYDEVAKLDPHGRSDVWSELRPGVEVKLSGRLTRVVREDGTNRYLVDGADVDATAPLLVAEDRIVIADDEASVPAGMREDAEWIAPLRGFLRSLGPKAAR